MQLIDEKFLNKHILNNSLLGTINVNFTANKLNIYKILTFKIKTIEKPKFPPSYSYQLNVSFLYPWSPIRHGNSMTCSHEHPSEPIPILMKKNRVNRIRVQIFPSF